MQTLNVTPTALLRTLLFQRKRWRALMLSIAFIAAVLGVLAPYAQKEFTDSLLHGHGGLEWIWAAFAFALGAQALSQLALWLGGRESLIAQKALGDALYARLLEGPGGLVGKRPAGEAVSLFAVDVPGAASLLDQVLTMLGSMVFPVLIAPIALHWLYGIPWYACAGAIVVLGLFNASLARRQSRFFLRFKQLAAERTGLVAEWIQNIRTLRILGWVETAEAKIFGVRQRETVNRKGMVTNGQVMNAVATSSTYVLNILAVVALLRIRGGAGAEPTPGELLSLLWILGVFLSRPLRQFPWILVIGLDSLSSIKRLQDAFAINIRQPQVMGTSSTVAQDKALLEVRGLNLNIDDRLLLKNVDLKLNQGELVAIVGEVGSGKSLILQSLMGGTGATFESYRIEGRETAGPADAKVRAQLAFVPQEGFTMSASLRENVRFEYLEDKVGGSHRDDSGVLRSLLSAQFVPERERVSDGLDTEIGERGVNLSGGQRQRIGLARAHFADRKIVVMDDCLSAVDVDTERRLIDELLMSEWSSRSRLLVTHRMSVLPYCDRVLFIEDGAITLEGTYAELLVRSPRFAEFVRREAVKAEKTATVATTDKNTNTAVSTGASDG